MADLVIQHVVFPLDPSVAPLYYHFNTPPPAPSADPLPQGRRSLVLGRGARIDSNTYFNGFFEAYWRQHTTLGRLVLRLRLSGAGTICLRRASRESGVVELGRAGFDGEDQTVEMEVSGDRSDPHECGILYFEVIAHSAPVVFLAGDWVAKGVEPRHVGLVAGYCTFNREDFVVRNIRALSKEPGLSDYLAHLIVVDQGTRKVQDCPDYLALAARDLAKVLLVEQGNFGGAGGFTRCMLEARRLDDATHVLLLDDDAIVEPESVFRTAAFFSLAREEFAVGGAMLDLLQPTKMYESGGFVMPYRIGVGGRGRNQSLLSPHNRLSLATPKRGHYNAWWFFACPLSAIEKVGLPLPLFIRCDDLEFGYRLLRKGIPTVTLPGLGVWHLPFYLKKRGWVDYYSRRNILVAVALHFSVSQVSLAINFLGRLARHLMTLDYFSAWALCEGTADYLRGPPVLEADPRGLHRRVENAYRELSPESPPKTEQRHAPSTINPIAIDNRFRNAGVVLYRHSERFVTFLARGLWLTLQLVFSHKRTIQKWRTETKRLTEEAFWCKYLGIPSAEHGINGDRAAGTGAGAENANRRLQIHTVGRPTNCRASHAAEAVRVG